MSGIESIVEPYFQVRWDSGKTADEAFRQAKEAAASAIRRRADQVDALTFEHFADRCCHESVRPDSVRGGAA